MTRVTTIEVNSEATRPMISEVAKPRTGPGAGGEEDEAGDQRGDVGVEDGPERAVVALVHRRPRRSCPLAQLLADALVDEHVGVDRDAQGQHEAGDARQRQRGVEQRQAGEDQQRR